MRLLWPILLIIAPALVFGDSVRDKEDDAVVAYIKKIEKFVSWPKAKALPEGPAFVFVAAVGDSNLCGRIEELHGHDLGNRHRIKVRVVTEDMLPANAHVVVIAVEDTAIGHRIVEKLTGSGTLTIARGPDRFGAILHFAARESDEGIEVQPEFSTGLAEEEGIEAKKALQMLARSID